MRATLLLGALLLAVACGSTRIYVPPTPEGKACWRECLAISNQCRASYWGALWMPPACNDQQGECLRSCPGAMDEAQAKEERARVEYDRAHSSSNSVSTPAVASTPCTDKCRTLPEKDILDCFQVCHGAGQQ
jgi:hypothetical protein